MDHCLHLCCSFHNVSAIVPTRLRRVDVNITENTELNDLFNLRVYVFPLPLNLAIIH